jgi:FkbM family methyltransferase
MSVRNLILNVLNRIFRLRGMELRALTPFECDDSMDAGLRRARRHAGGVGTVIDVGAAEGKWTRRALRHFPDARYLLVEPLSERVPVLEALRTEISSVDFVTAAAGAEAGSVTFHVAEDLDGSGVCDRPEANTRAVPVTTLDGEVARLQLPPPYFIKLDTHGFEIPILKGASAILAKTELLMIEAYNFKLTEGCLRFHELCAWLEERDFRSSDIIEPLRRPGDTMLWQMDLVFVRREHSAFARTTYQ